MVIIYPVPMRHRLRAVTDTCLTWSTGPGAVLSEGHLWPGEGALHKRGDTGWGHAPPAAQALRAAPGLPGSWLILPPERLRHLTAPPCAQCHAGGQSAIIRNVFDRPSTHHSEFTNWRSWGGDYASLVQWCAGFLFYFIVTAVCLVIGS